MQKKTNTLNEKEQRLAEALKQNLRKRKLQKKAKRQGKAIEVNDSTKNNSQKPFISG